MGKDQQRLLEVDQLQTHFLSDDGVVKAADGVTFDVLSGEVLGIVGESGCGKSVTALSVMGLIRPPGQIVGGEIRFRGRRLLSLSDEEVRKIRGREISMIFQQPQSCLNPVFTVGDQVREVFSAHHGIDRETAAEKARRLLASVGIPDVDKKYHAYPHEMSGGQAQRVMIAMALALEPSLLIADEPTTALDVTIQAQILGLIRTLRSDIGSSVILITHDLGIVAEMADRVNVMYAGQFVEKADVVTLYQQPVHPYTRGLLASIPKPGEERDRLAVIPGTVPSLVDLPEGCRFAPRCKERAEHGINLCLERSPDMIEIKNGHHVRCWLFQDQPIPERELAHG